jgi:stage V sporulation protein AA
MKNPDSREVYIQLQQRVTLHNPRVRLRDLADIYCTSAATASALGDLVVLTFHEGQRHQVLSALELVSVITRQLPEVSVNVLGASDMVLTLKLGKPPCAARSFLTGAAVCLITFFGAAFSVASFNNDVDISLLFDQILTTFHASSDLLSWLQVSYSVGIPLGILIFYNHLSKKSMEQDPTPLEIEMRLYEQEEADAIIQNQQIASDNRSKGESSS